MKRLPLKILLSFLCLFWSVTALSKTEIDKQMQMRECYLAYHSELADSDGKVSFAVSTDVLGRVSKIKLKEYTLKPSANFMKCMVTKIRNWDYPIAGVLSKNPEKIHKHSFYFENKTLYSSR